MEVNISLTFERDLQRLKNAFLEKKSSAFVQEIMNAPNVETLTQIKKMKGTSFLYRKRIGDYRIGFSKEQNGSILLRRIAHRKDIYKVFP